ncbi:MAG: hypothetical protein P1U81_17825 [Verrucomicrobiales bacterium]|nr:hypothetical protein [Verrucomicrobiales bacterium]
MRRFLAAVLALAVSPSAFAALPPRSADQLQESAELIITGEVLASRVLVHRRPSASTYLVRLGVKIDSVEKGQELIGRKTSLDIRCWSIRKTRLAGPSGHSDIPADGSRFRMWLRQNGEGFWEPLEPNGIELLEGAAAMTFAEVEKQYSLRQYGIAGALGLLTLAIFGAFRFRNRLFRRGKAG